MDVNRTNEPGVKQSMTTKITIEVSRDGWTRGLQVSINLLDEDGNGHGYRIAGPKFNGSSKALLTETLDAGDAEEIRRYLEHIEPRAAS